MAGARVAGAAQLRRAVGVRYAGTPRTGGAVDAGAELAGARAGAGPGAAGQRVAGRQALGIRGVVQVGAGVGAIRAAVTVHVVIIAGVTDAVRVGVFLAGVGDAHAIVAEIADTVAVGVLLAGVVDERTFVDVEVDIITVQVVEIVLGHLTVTVTVAVLIEVVDDELLVRTRNGEDAVRQVRDSRECDVALEQSGGSQRRACAGARRDARRADEASGGSAAGAAIATAGPGRVQRVPLGVRLEDREPVGGEEIRVAVGDDHHLDARSGRGQLRIVHGDPERLFTLVQILAIDGDGGALVTRGKTPRPRRREPVARRGVWRDEGRLVQRVCLVPLEDHVVDAESVVEGKRGRLDAVEAQGDSPAVAGRPVIGDPNALRRRGTLQGLGREPSLEADQGLLEVPHRPGNGDLLLGAGTGAAAGTVRVQLARGSRIRGRRAADARSGRARLLWELHVVGTRQWDRGGARH